LQEEEKSRIIEMGGKFMNALNKLLQAIAVLESKIDLLETEQTHVNQLLKECGLPKGIQSLKESAQEILRKRNNDPS
jgi:hypothetical protein